MKVDILDGIKLIQVNSLKEIKQSRILTSNLSFQKDGLLSNDIFGYSTRDRQTTFAYIDLHGHYIHPMIYKDVFQKSMRIVPQIISGTQTVSVQNGKLTPDPSGWTGIENLYKHWDEVTVYGATPKSEGNVILPSLSKKDVFLDKLVIIPPFYHDADVDAKTRKVKISDLTSMYSKLIADVQFMITTKTSFDIMMYASQQKIQNQLVEIEQYLANSLAKKQGYIRRRLLSKTTDYGIRSVLTAPSFTGQEADLYTYEYDKIYIPIALLNSGAYPFILRSLKEFFSDIENRVHYDVPDDNPDEWVIWQPELQFDLQYIETLVDNYNKFVENRFKPIQVEIQNIVTKEKKTTTIYEQKVYYKDKDGKQIDHTEQTPITPTDLCFRACYDSCYDRYAMTTRYPVLNIYGIFFAKVEVLSTNQTLPVKVQGHFYPKYPIINPNLLAGEMASQFFNTIKFSLSRLGGLERDEPVKRIELREVA